LADAANAYLYAQTGREYRLDANYVGKLEQGVHRWPSEPIRRALRAVLDATRDADLGFCSTRQPLVVAENMPGPVPVPGTDPTDRSGRAQQVRSDFGCRLKELRELRGLSFRRLGQQVHYSHSYLWELESGGKRPTEAVASALDAALGAGGELSALAAGSLAAQAVTAVPFTGAPSPVLTLTVTASHTGALRVVIDAVPPDDGAGNELVGRSDGGAQVYSLTQTHRLPDDRRVVTAVGR
jgi:transcriptional regulator with XRE-family HTH domain